MKEDDKTKRILYEPVQFAGAGAHSLLYFLPFSHCYRCEMYKYGLVGVDVGAGYVLCISMGVFSVQRSEKFFCSFVTPLCRIHVSFYVDKVSFIFYTENDATELQHL